MGFPMWIMEQPVAIALGGLIVVVALLGGLLETGRRSLLYAAVVAGLLTVTLLVVERQVVTPREEVRATLQRIANLLEEDDIPAVMQHLSTSRSELREKVRYGLRRFQVLEAQIKRNLTIDVATHHGMEVAEARFNATARLRGRRGMVDERPYPRFVVVNLRKEEGQWRVRAYEDHDPRKGI